MHRKLISPQISLVTGEQIDFDEFAAFQRNAFDTTNRFVKASSIQTSAYYRWKYHNPAGEARVAQAWNGQELVASVSAIPAIFTGAGVKKVVWQLGDIATHPGHRGKGYFRRCTEALLASTGKEPVFSLPNNQSYQPLIRLGFKDVACLSFWFSIVGSSHGSILLSHRVHKELKLDAPVRPLQAGQLAGSVDASFLTWRYLEHPLHRYSIVTWNLGLNREVMTVTRDVKVAGIILTLVIFYRGTGTEAEASVLHAIAARKRGHLPHVTLVGTSDPELHSKAHWWRVHPWMVGRRFPVVGYNVAERELKLCVGDWDVF